MLRLLAVLLAAALLAACGSQGRTPTTAASAPTTREAAAAPPLNVGVSTDLPGVGSFDASAHVRSGFDVDLYRWLANESPEFTPVEVDLPIKDRVNALVDKKVGIVVAGFSITDERRKSISFAGPYLETQQGVLIRADDKRIAVVNDLSGKTVCAPRGSTSLAQLSQAQQGRITIVEVTGSQECVDKLVAGQVDAFSTDQLMLYGFARKDAARVAVVPNLVFGAKERYGIGLPKGDVALCRQLSEKLRTFMTSGAWEEFFRTNFGELSPAGYKPDPYVLDPC
ncbi:transporter substrate-binding domain-containing protein [Lentzea tibetensis]|uniref:Transporter substrate-binding domain-containing protein n=1 Tax=Lentzea tibetensis TaxID=2591470 RepID=A0A563EPU1_9PSEU|nr:transporter substrate-binding domain-containing protein [Lentzea tibetensis]TWP49355.1 transporter substrate-binding domain-containing protein [Lentzea tibetensis]